MPLLVLHRALAIAALSIGILFALGPLSPRRVGTEGDSAVHALAPIPAMASSPTSARSDSAPAPTRVSMRHVDFYVDSAVILHIRQLDGTMRSKEGGPILFDDKKSFVIAIDRAEVGLTAADLTTLLNKFVFGYKGSPLTRLHVYTEGDQIVLKGRMHKVITFNFEITANIDVTNQTMLRMHPTKTRVMGLNGEKLLHLLGLSLEQLLDLKGATGATVHGNDIFLDPAKILPPPTIEGRVTAVRVDGDEVVQTFGGAAAHAGQHALVPPDTKAPSYMYFKGGTLRFGRLLMLDAEMQIVDLDKSEVFHFDLARYNAQLVAGYERTLADGGLEVWMRDVEKLGAALTPAARPVARTMRVVVGLR
ncbi:MAG: hypothetical protein M3Y05_07055 [Gemmatimonadota bacterium]|nr:hypothetical protein [Gemmatimonadota bacterium]